MVDIINMQKHFKQHFRVIISSLVQPYELTAGDLRNESFKIKDFADRKQLISHSIHSKRELPSEVYM